MAESRVLIGVTAALEPAVRGVWHERFGMTPETYLHAVGDAGGAPVLLPPQPVDAAVVDRVLGAVDALVLTGGSDVDPARYGAVPHPETQQPRLDRDAWEFALLEGALARDLPVLAICRGLQVLNAALGGTLIQHVPDVTGNDVHAPMPGVYGRTDVVVRPESGVAALLGGAATLQSVHCHHHQAIERVAPGLEVAATGSGGIIEAVELPAARFVYGVQWHPEENAADRRLFAALVAAARGADAAGAGRHERTDDRRTASAAPAGAFGGAA